MKKGFILGLIVGGLLFGTSVFAVSNYLYTSDEITYTPNDQSWSVSSVSKALDDLRDKAKNYMPIPTATKSITANGSNIDVKNYAKVNVNVPNRAVYLGKFTNNTTMDVSKLGATSASQFLVVTEGGGYAEAPNSNCSSAYRCDYGTAYIQPGSVSLSGNTLSIKIGYVHANTNSNSGVGLIPVSVYYVGSTINYGNY